MCTHIHITHIHTTHVHVWVNCADAQQMNTINRMPLRCGDKHSFPPENHLQGELNKVMNPGTKPMLWVLWQQCCLIYMSCVPKIEWSTGVAPPNIIQLRVLMSSCPSYPPPPSLPGFSGSLSQFFGVLTLHSMNRKWVMLGGSFNLRALNSTEHSTQAPTTPSVSCITNTHINSINDNLF